MNSVSYKSIEFFIIFILIPVSYSLPYSAYLKLALGFLGMVYIIYVLLKIENQKFKITQNLNWKRFWKETLIKLLVIAFLTTLYVWLTSTETLFEVVINKPVMWLKFIFIYSFFLYILKSYCIELSFLNAITCYLIVTCFFFLLTLLCFL